MIAIDSSVLVDVLTDDGTFAEASRQSLDDALSTDEIVVCDVVVAEVHAILASSTSAMDELSSLGIRFLPTSEHASVRAGHMQQRFRQRGGTRERVVADFIVGSHALLQCGALITRDAGFFRDYFKGLKVIVPRAATLIDRTLP